MLARGQHVPKQCEQLLRTEIDASYPLTPALLIAKGFRAVTAIPIKLKIKEDVS